MLVQQLHAIQSQHGYLPEAELRALSEKTGTPLYRMQEVASFYPHFHREPPPPVEVHVCRDVSCQLRGSCETLKALREVHQNDERVQVDGVSCLGRCDRAPVVRVTSEATTRNYCDRTLEEMQQIVQQTAAKEPPAPDTDTDYRVDVDTWRIDPYSAGDVEPYAAVREFLRSDVCSKEEVIAALETAGLLGMGGAGGRTYKKWNDVLNADGDVKYVVCNGDESEPGTFKDRELLLRKPHLVLEGVILAGLLIGAEHAYIYIRHEYEEQIEAIRAEIENARSLGLCGEDVLGSGKDLPVSVFVSPGGYICGEQTALIEAMEDKRAEPRNRPPELQTNGLWDCPTLLNNVETLAWVPAIVLKERGQWFADQGRDEYRGARLFSISGDVASPGVYEAPIGLTLGQLIEEFAGGMKDGAPMKAVALSGPSGGFLPRRVPIESLAPGFVKTLDGKAESYDLWQMPLDINVSRRMGVMMAAGIIVYGEGRNMVAAAASASRFFRNESCGKCVPCRIGSQKLVELLDAIERRELTQADVFGGETSHVKRLVDELTEAMRLTAICGLGMVASNPMHSLLLHFRDDVEQYLSADGTDGNERRPIDKPTNEN